MLQPYGVIHTKSTQNDLMWEVNREYNIGIRTNICKCGNCMADYSGQRRGRQARPSTGNRNKMRSLKKKERIYGKKVIQMELTEHTMRMDEYDFDENMDIIYDMAS